MTTLSELRTTYAAANLQVNTLQRTVDELRLFMSNVGNMIAENNTFAETIDVDAFITLQTSEFTALLTAVEVAADDLNTDILN